MKKIEILKDTGYSNNKRIAYLCGNYVCITRFEYIDNAPITNRKVRVVVSNDTDWKNANPYNLFLNSIDNGLATKFKNLEQFELYANNKKESG